MNDPRDAQLRISHDDRDHALEALTEHSRKGRLSIDEYGDRVTALDGARMRADLPALFDDLPEPRPRFAEAAQTTAPGAAVAVPPESALRGPRARRWVPRRKRS